MISPCQTEVYSPTYGRIFCANISHARLAATALFSDLTHPIKDTHCVMVFRESEKNISAQRQELKSNNVEPIADFILPSLCVPAQSCDNNLRFDYAMQACNRTCRSLSGHDPACDIPDNPVEGCGCLSGTHLNTPVKCSPRALCHCNYPGGTTPPGPVVIDGRQWYAVHIFAL